jgi:DNA-binding NarL/FixJ family response regulator
MAASRRDPPLADRQWEAVLSYALRGRSMAETARAMHISPHTVHQHIRQAYRRAGIAPHGYGSPRTRLALWAWTTLSAARPADDAPARPPAVRASTRRGDGCS